MGRDQQRLRFRDYGAFPRPYPDGEHRSDDRCLHSFVRGDYRLVFASGAFRLDAALEEEARSAVDLAAFVEEYGLTPREAEVLVLVTADERALKEIASEMDISLCMLQKHLTSIYKKTDMQHERPDEEVPT